MTSGFTKALVIGALSSLGALAWSGCGPGSEERYYCDNGGCYSCDAYGCNDVTAQPKPTCSSTQACQVGVCTTAGCAETCANDSNCPRGNTCQSGLCALPGKTPVPLPTTDAGPGPTPTDAGPNPTECTATSCTGGKVCVSGVCTAPENACMNQRMAGEVRAVCDPDNIRAEFAIQVASAWQGHALGALMMDKLLNYLRTRGTAEVVGQCLRENAAMVALARSAGFTVTEAVEGFDLRLTLVHDMDQVPPAAAGAQSGTPK